MHQRTISIRTSRRRATQHAVLAAAALAGIAGVVPSAAAGTLYWDGSGAAAGVSDGPGTWSTDSANRNWFDGATNVSWNNDVVNDAVFGINSGLTPTTTLPITVGSPVTVGDITFAAPLANGQYVLGGQAITLGGAASTITVQSPSATIGSVLAGTGLTKTGAGTLQLNGSAANTYAGPTTVNAGTLSLNFANLAGRTNFVAPTSKLVLAGGTLAVAGHASGTTNQTFGGEAFDLTRGSTIVLTPSGTHALNLTLPNTWNRSPGATLVVNRTATGTSSLKADVVSGSGAPVGGVLPYVLVRGVGAGAGFGAVSGGQVTRYTGASEVLTSENLVPGTNHRFALSGAHTLGGDETTANSLELVNTRGTSLSTLSLAGKTLALTSGGLLFNTGMDSATNQIAIDNGQLGASDSELIIHKVGNALATIGQTTMLSGGTGSVTISGDGNGSSFAMASTVSTYSGGTRFNYGAAVAVTGASVGTPGAPTRGPLGVGPLTLAGGSIRSSSGGQNTILNSVVLANDTVFAGGGSAITFSGPVTLAHGTHKLDVASSGATTFSGAIDDGANTLGIIKAGASVLVLGGASTYDGPTTLAVGTLRVSASSTGTGGAVTSGPLGRGTLVLGPGTLQSDSAAPRTIHNPVLFAQSASFGSTNAALNGKLPSPARPRFPVAAG